MRTRAVGLFSAAMVSGALLVTAPVTAGAAPISGQAFAAYGSGAAVITKALQLGTTTIANAEAAFSGGVVNSQGLGAPVTNEFGINIQPATPGKNAFGRGTGLETGLVTSDPQQATLNQILLSGLATAAAPPPSSSQKEIALDLNPVAFASVLRGNAAANYDPTYCPVGRPLTFGQGYASNLQLLNTSGSPANPSTGFGGSVLGTSTAAAGTQRGASQSRTVTYLTPNGDGTFGVVSETRQTVAPISLLSTAGTGLLVEIAGEFGLRVAATGKPGGSSVAYTGNPVITVSTTVANVAVPILGPISLQSLLGQNGLSVPVPPLATVGLGTPPRAINGAINSAPSLAADGTSASGAADAVRLSVLSLPGISALDLALGHMEGAVSVPAGGLTCDIPVSKTASVDPVNVGQDFSYQIKIPSDPALFNSLFNCDLIGISATDTVTTKSGSPTITLVSADHGGVIAGNKVTWPSLGNYTLGQDPIVLTINARIPTSSGAGVLQDTVDVNASLGNCRGGTTGEDIINGSATLNGKAQLEGGAIKGAVTLVAPNVSRGGLAATGGNSWPLVAGGGFLLGALGLVRLRRRATDATVTAKS